jgi:shikimate dehydrogenase
MRKACVIGHPVAHSLSPRLHGYWFSQLGLEGEYIARDVPPEKLADALNALAVEGYRGANLTLPHKQAAMALVHSLDAAAQAIGAVNTVVVQPDGSLHGMNTDAQGFAASITGMVGAGAQATVLGAGGAARAVVYALREMGLTRVRLCNRSQNAAEALAASFSGVEAWRWQAREDALVGSDLLVNCTSLGLTGGEALTLSLASLPKHAVVADIVYKPLETPLLAQARAAGFRGVDGLGMLMGQGAAAFAAWFGVQPQVDDALRRHMVEAL